MSNNNGSTEFKFIPLTEIAGFATRDARNTRNHLISLGKDKYVTFRSELEPDLPPDEAGNVVKDERLVLTEMVLGDTATKKSREEFLTLVKGQDADLYSLAMGIHTRGLLQPVGVHPMKVGAGLGLVFGARRFLAYLVLNVMFASNDNYNVIQAKIIEDTDTDVQSMMENTHRSQMLQIEEGKKYKEYKEATGLSWAATAHKFDLYTPGGKVNVQHVQRYAALWDDAVPQKERDRLVEGKTSIEKVLEGLKVAKAAKKGEIAEVPEKTITRKTSLSHKKVIALVNDAEGIEKILSRFIAKHPEASNEDIFRLGLFTAAQEKFKKIKVAPAPKAEVAEDASEDAEAEVA